MLTPFPSFLLSKWIHFLKFPYIKSKRKKSTRTIGEHLFYPISEDKNGELT